MKKIVYLLAAALAVSCSGGGNSKYEKIISDIVQTDHRGTKYDLKFKALEIQEIGKISVADSISILKEEFDAYRNKYIGNLEESIKRAEQGIEKEKGSRLSFKTMIPYYEKRITEDRHTIDSLKLLEPVEVKKYDNRKPDEVLVNIVRCKYSIVPPTMNTTAEETFDFYLSPDGKLYTKKRFKG